MKHEELKSIDWNEISVAAVTCDESLQNENGMLDFESEYAVLEFNRNKILKLLKVKEVDIK